MHEKRDDYEPIIATRRSRERPSEDTQPLWRLVLALVGGLAVAGLIVWWWMGRTSNDSAPTAAQSEGSLPETHVEQAPLPPARDSETGADIAQAPTPAARDSEPNVDIAQEPAPSARDSDTSAGIAQDPAPPTRDAEPAPSPEQAATPENIPEAVAAQEPASLAAISVRIMSPDPQVQVVLRGPLDSSPPLTGRVGDVIAVAPGTYRVVASGAQLETFEQKVIFDGERALEYVVELCAERKHERESLAGQIVESRACESTAQCESMFMILSEHAGQLVNDRDFRTQACAKWRPNAAPDGRWTLNTQCGGATLETTCRIEIAEGACTFAEPGRSVRGGSCPRAELR